MKDSSRPLNPSTGIGDLSVGGIREINYGARCLNHGGIVSKLRCDFIVTNSEGKETAGFFLGEMDLKDVLEIEAKLLAFMGREAEEQKAKLG